MFGFEILKLKIRRLLWKPGAHGDKLAEFLATWDDIMIHIDESTVDTDLKGSIFEQMEKPAKMIEYLKMYQRAPEGHENGTFKFLYDSAKLIVNTERYKTNRDRRQTTECDFVPDPFCGRTRPRRAILTKMLRTSTREKSRSARKQQSFPNDKPDPDKAPLCRFCLLGKCQKGNG